MPAPTRFFWLRRVEQHPVPPPEIVPRAIAVKIGVSAIKAMGISHLTLGQARNTLL